MRLPTTRDVYKRQVDDRVAVNGLGYQAVERALRAFAVDGVKAHRQSGERGQIGQERGE